MFFLSRLYFFLEVITQTFSTYFPRLGTRLVISQKNTHKKIILNRPISIQQPLFENIKQLRNSSEFPEYLVFQPKNYGTGALFSLQKT